MTLKEFLSLIEDEEARIELEIDDDSSDEYKYHHFWLSDYRVNLDIAKYHSDSIVESFSFIPEMESSSKIKIRIRH